MEYVHGAVYGEIYDTFCGLVAIEPDVLTSVSDDITCPDCLQVIDANDY